MGDWALVGHGGSVPGFLASLVIDIERGVAAIELANATGRPFCGADLLALLEQYDSADTVSTNSNVRRTPWQASPRPAAAARQRRWLSSLLGSAALRA